MYGSPDPSDEWLAWVIENMFEPEWIDANIDYVLNNLHDYLSDSYYLLNASHVLDHCLKFAMELGRYKLLRDLFEVVLDTFDGDKPIAYMTDYSAPLPDWIHQLNHRGNTNQDRYPDEFFRLKLNLGYVATMMRDFRLAKTCLQEILDLMETTNQINQLDAYCVILQYMSFGHQLNASIDFVRKTKQLAHKYTGRLQYAYSIIALYQYSQSDAEAVEKIRQQLHRAFNYTTRDWIEFHNITAEQHYYLSVIHREKGEFDKALDHLNQAETHFDQVNTPESSMLILQETALWFTLKNENDSQHEHHAIAQEKLDSAKQIFNQLENQQDYHLPMLEHTQGLIYLNTGRYKDALNTFEQVLIMWQDRQSQYNTALTYNVIGFTNYNLKNYDNALKYYKQAEALCIGLEQEHAKRLMRTIQTNITNVRQNLNP